MNTNSLNKNNIYNTISTALNLLFPLITFPYVSRVLGVENIGIFNFSSSVVSYFSLIATLGISSYAIRECAKVNNDRKEFSDLASEIYSIDMYSTILAYVLLFIALVVFRKLRAYSFYIIVLSSSFILGTIGTLWVCNAVNDFKYIAVRNIVLHIFSFVTLLLFVKSSNDLYIYVMLTIIASCGSNLFNVFYRKKYCDIHFIFKPNIKKHIKKIILMFSQTISMLLYTNSDMLMIGIFHNDYNVGLYAISVRIYNIVNSMIASSVWVAVPQLANDYKNKDYVSFNNKLTYVVNYILLLAIPALIGINILAKEIVYIIAGESLHLTEISLRILTISMIGSLVAGTIGYGIIFPMGYDRVNFYSCIISATSNVLLNLYFIPKYGIIGAAITTAIAEFLGIFNKIKYIDKNIKVHNLLVPITNYLIGSFLFVLFCRIIANISLPIITRGIVSIVGSILIYFMYLLIVRDGFFIEFIRPVINKINIINQ